jgi:YD repeat-containing protein
MKAWSRMEYDVDGRLTARLIHNANGSEWVTRYTYDNSGRILKIQSGSEGQPLTDTIYSYSDQGRLLTITNSRSPANTRYCIPGRLQRVAQPRSQDCETGGHALRSSCRVPRTSRFSMSGKDLDSCTGNL